MDEQGLRDEAEPVAETRVKRSLVLLEIARQEEIDVSESELQEETTRTLDSITQFMSEPDRKRFDSPEALLNITGNIYAELRMNRTIEYLRSVANGEAEDSEASESEESETEQAAEGPESEMPVMEDEDVAESGDENQVEVDQTPAAEVEEQSVAEDEAPANKKDEDSEDSAAETPEDVEEPE
jgi:hypothetical protein